MIKKLEQKLHDLQIAFTKDKIKRSKYDSATEILKEVEVDALSFKVLESNKSKEVLVEDDDEQVMLFLNSDFQKYRFIKGYNAIWSEEKKSIECKIETYRRPPRKIFEMLKNKVQAMQELDEYDEDFEGPQENCDAIQEFLLFNVNGIDIKFKQSSNELIALLSSRRDVIPLRTHNKYIYSIVFDNCKISSHKEAQKVIEKLGISTEFLLAEQVGSELRLSQNQPKRSRRDRVFETEKSEVLLAPKYEYDVEPMSLYLHAKSHRSMALYTYLAFYQVLEYYFPKYSEINAKETIRKTLRDPIFNIENDGHIDKLLRSVKMNRNYGFSDELTQLKSTIAACVDVHFLKELYNSDIAKEYYQDKTSKLVSDKKLSIKNGKFDENSVVNQLAERIYDMRCSIVHKKSSFNENSLIASPHTISYSEIGVDMEIIQILAYKVLVNNCKKLSL